MNRFWPLLLIFVAACSPSAPSDGDAKTSDDNAFTGVPTCTNLDIHALIEKTHDPSPDYQCEVSPGLSRSSQPDERWIESLANPSIRKVPFRAVVNLRGEPGANGEAPIVRKYGMTPLDIPVIDMHAPTRDQALEFLAFVTDPAHQPADVHCKAGQGRTGTFVAVYRMAVQGWKPEDAIAEARAWNVHDAQIAFLEDFARTLDDDDVRKFRGAPGSTP